MSRVSDIGSLYLIGTTHTRGPCYTGICLPKNVLDLFPSSRSDGTYVTRCIKDNDSVEMVLKHGVLSDFISECDEYSVSSLSEISSKNRHACLLCCRTTQNGTNRFDSTNSVPEIGSGGPNTSDMDLSGSSTSIKKFPENGNLDTTYNSHIYNSSESHLSDENYTDKIQETVLRHVHCTAYGQSRLEQTIQIGSVQNETKESAILSQYMLVFRRLHVTQPKHLSIFVAQILTRDFHRC